MSNAEHTMEMNAEVPVGTSGTPIKVGLAIKSSERNIALIADKAFNERIVETTDEGITTRTLAFPYEQARDFYAQTTEMTEAAQATVASQSADATGLDDRLDDLIGEAKDVIAKTKITATSAVDADGKRGLNVIVNYDGNEVVNFDAADIGGAISSAVSTGLDDDDAEGAEVVADNATPTTPTRYVARYRATANGENDRLESENDNVLVQSKGGLFVISAADINLNVGINANLAIFIA